MLFKERDVEVKEYLEKIQLLEYSYQNIYDLL